MGFDVSFLSHLAVRWFMCTHLVDAGKTTVYLLHAAILGILAWMGACRFYPIPAWGPCEWAGLGQIPLKSGFLLRFYASFLPNLRVGTLSTGTALMNTICIRCFLVFNVSFLSNFADLLVYVDTSG